jgi:hypothetical protein
LTMVARWPLFTRSRPNRCAALSNALGHSRHFAPQQSRISISLRGLEIDGLGRKRTSAPFSSALRLVSILASPPIATARPPFVQKNWTQAVRASTSFRSAYAYASSSSVGRLFADRYLPQASRCNGKTVWSGSDDDDFDHRHQSGLSCLNGP